MKKIVLPLLLTSIVATGIFVKSSIPDVPSYELVKKNHQSSDLMLLDNEGRLLHQWRQDQTKRTFAWTPLKEISIALVPALLKSEDKRFFKHSGVDIQAMAASAYQRILKSSSRGASTITMQVVKLAKPSTAWNGWMGKIRQALAAWSLERSWTKEEILEAYLNLAPFRGEYRGIAAISWALYNKAPSALTSKEATLLSVLLRSPNANEKEWAQRACWQEPSSCGDFPNLIANSMLKSANFPKEGQRALHLAQRLSREQYTGTLKTFINSELQSFVQQTIESQIQALLDQNVHDAAVLVVENQTGKVVAYVGGSGALSSANYVDGILSQRQAGSTLKPFLYATAFEKNVLKPDSWLEDSAVDIVFDRGVYKPQNHDHMFYGWVKAKVALASSLNVPAVKVFKLLNDNSFWEKLQSLHFRDLRDPDFYGPALALGVADINLEDLTQAYRTFANGGQWSPLLFTASDASSHERVFTDEASEQITAILSAKENRALGFGMDSNLSLSSDAAVKTGTSKDMRDNWCVGYNSKFTVGVWVGNFSGQPMWNVMGVTGAAPIWNTVMSYLQDKYPSPGFKLTLNTTATGKEKSPRVYPKARILYPQDGMILAVDPAIPLKNQKMPLLVEGPQKKNISWRINGKKVGSAAEPYLWTPIPGKHTFELLSGNTATQKVQVIVK
ncbi:penicillin-binding protein 1C [Bdellovibrio sp. NC01]|uniref:penicillin-binding protein 1C n=1 Tax=Bdellovibrio sp. NC01 TaxID=2220073 RepID=UPI00115AA575|nr:penicillin-binding protein 1C [Bdellovibrio sp. NC01]QDK36339.1 penicillin-binding protein 1C [Bdellovibrio sp. NC01]